MEKAMRETNEWYMQTRVTGKDGNRWSSHIFVTANSFEDAVEKAVLKCEELNGRQDGHLYEASGVGHRMTVGGGCKW